MSTTPEAEIVNDKINVDINESVPTLTPTPTPSIRDGLKKLSLNERQQLFDSIIKEEINESIIEAQKARKASLEETTARESCCPLSKQIKQMQIDIQNMKLQMQMRSVENKKTCPYFASLDNEIRNELKSGLFANKLNTLDDEDIQYTSCLSSMFSFDNIFFWIFVALFLFSITTKPKLDCKNIFTSL
jgi:hypothetical protein